MSIEGLKKEIDRIVSPIKADPRLKERYQKELWRHLLELCEQERAQGLDDSQARAAALRRLGDPEDLRAQFVASLSRLDRIFGRVYDSLEQREGERSLRYAIRCSRNAALVATCGTAALFTPTILLITWFKGHRPEVVFFLPVFAFVLVFFVASAIFWAALFARRADAATIAGRRGPALGYLALILALFSLSSLVGLALGHLALGAAMGMRHTEVYMLDYIFALVLGVTLMGAGFGGTLSVFLGPEFTRRLVRSD